VVTLKIKEADSEKVLSKGDEHFNAQLSLFLDGVLKKSRKGEAARISP
jgi:hypothetical protein